jgi:hypothetical protein
LASDQQQQGLNLDKYSILAARLTIGHPSCEETQSRGTSAVVVQTQPDAKLGLLTVNPITKLLANLMLFQTKLT